MSFNNGQRRYGHVPPAQYGQHATQQNHGLQRQPSFDNGDDGALVNSNNYNRYQTNPAYPGSSQPVNMPQEHHYTTTSPIQSPRSPGLNSFGSPNSALSGYQHIYQPYPNESQSAPPPQVTYNPQHFARSQSTTQPPSQYRPYNSAAPAAPYNNTTPTYGGQQVQHQPYNPAAYPPTAQYPSRHSTVSGYNYTPSYGSPGIPQSPSFPPQPSYGTSPATSRPQQPTYEQSYQSNQGTYASSNYAPSNSGRPTLHNTLSSQYPTNGSSYATTSQVPYPTRPAYTQIPDGPAQHVSDDDLYANMPKRTSTNSMNSDIPPPIPSHDVTPSASSSNLQRHPTLRPLPSAPVEEANQWPGEDHSQSSQELTDQLFAEIGSALNDTSGRSHGNGDLLDDEVAQGYQPTPSKNNDHGYDFDEESDLEAAAGLEAMRLAEEQEAQGVLGFAFHQAPAVPTHQQSPEESSDSDYKAAYGMDLGLASGGYDAHVNYPPDNADVHTGHSSEMEDQSRPLPTPSQLNRSESHSHSHASSGGLGGMTDYSLPDGDNIHPFPAFESARVDTYGTGGLQRPNSTSHLHRLSFDEGDERVSIHSRLTESRQSGRSGSDSPTRDDMPELFYHPGMGGSAYNRPLPAVPSLSDSRVPQLQPAGSYRNSTLQHSYSSSTDSSYRRSVYTPVGPESYTQSTLTPNSQYVPRSSSLSSHPSTPQAVPPSRSKTDADERQARQKAGRLGLRPVSGMDYDLTTPTAMPLDLPALPAGRRKKFQPSKLSSGDFRKCKEPWALSGIAEWIRDMAGGDTGEGEPDLRKKAIEEGIVALFTHKVPTMNTADAETLTQKVVNSMFDAGILLPDEEWIKFGRGEISGVLWQLTGSGCYSPKVHEQEIHGRCYSHHCGRTLKKIDLQAQGLEASRKTEDWATFFKITKETLDATPPKEILRQNNLHEIVTSEDLFMDNLNVLRVLYRDQLLQQKPPIISESRLQKFITSVFGKVDAIKDVNENFLLAQLKYRQKEQGPWIIGFSDLFREWIRKAKGAYLEYAAGLPYAIYLIEKERDRNLLFQQFLNQAQDNPLSRRLDWQTYIRAPTTRLQRYGLLLEVVLKNMKGQDTEEKANLATAIEEIKAVTLECDAKVAEQDKKVAMIALQAKLVLRPSMERVELNLDHLGRELIHQGDLQRAGGNRFQWLETHAILFDHYLVLAKTIGKPDIGGRKREIYDVSKLPIPMQLLVLESTNDDPVVKSSVKGIGTVTTVTKPAPMVNGGANASRPSINSPELDRTSSNTSIPTVSSVTRLSTNTSLDENRLMYPFRVKHLGKTDVYTLYASSEQKRQEWCDKILEAKTRYASSLYQQNAEPFRLRVIADSAFAYDALTAGSYKNIVPVPGTPLERSIRDIERLYDSGPRPQPVCKAQVNCATTFNCFGKQMTAIGTDYGVFTSEVNDPRGWTRTIQIARVTQITVLEEFSICLIIADKSLIAYHLDVIIPTSNFPAAHADNVRRAPQKLSGNKDVSFFATARMKDRTLVFYKKKEGLSSTFKVLEPVFQKSTEKKSRLFSRKVTGTTEFFREFDEFYIPTECFTINLFHSYIAISTAKGFELMTLDKKLPMSIPDLKNPSIASIAARIQNQKPLGMFRLSDAEFLLCYEECAVYVDKHGDVSRSVIMQYVGRAKSAALYGAYLVLFDSDFVEIRNAENGRLRQVIAGKDVRGLDYGVNPLGAGATQMGQVPEKRTLKLAMAHPEVPGSQIVLEMLLNEGHFE
ncbi:rhoGEF protein-like protein [Xylogone sp. PMI_703]|nr:rhoGEF protein-like protein [Xylogone sp. PMI_703]